MSLGNAPRKGSRVSGVQLPPNRFAVAWDVLKRADVLSRIGMCFLAGVAIWTITAGWQPPFAYRQGTVPPRDIVAAREFQSRNEEATELARDKFRSNFLTVYQRSDLEFGTAIRDELISDVKTVLRAETWESLSADEAGADIWQEFMNGLSPTADPTSVKTDQEVPAKAIYSASQRFEAFRNAFADDPDAKQLDVLKEMLDAAFAKGLLNKPQHGPSDGSPTKIYVTASDALSERSVDELTFDRALDDLHERLRTLDTAIGDHIDAWLRYPGRLQETLRFDPIMSDQRRNEALAILLPVFDPHLKGEKLAEGGVPLTAESISLLRKEYDQSVADMSLLDKLGHSLANFGMYSAVVALCGFYSTFRRRKVLMAMPTLARVLCLAVATVALSWFAPIERPETVIVPLLLFAMTVVIAYDQELALLLSTVMAVLVVVALGFGFTEFTIYVATMATAVLCLRHVRSRTKLIYVGLVTAAVTGATAVGAYVLAGSGQDLSVLSTAGWFAFFAAIAGLLMTGLLPFIENLFDVQTELSLLELGDVAHPLLQELVRRAPGTYNHTINVASIAEAAAEAVGSNGLLVRVGAYFHDIGKMLKPGYFIENQEIGNNRHESLLPAMSTLVIIAHVKDGADLARQHGLPNSLVDFILQHHGTTLVEYFYNRASEQSESNPDGGEVDEHSYRYPGPKPQSKEAAVLMVADAVESACRALTDPTPSRIEGLVHDLAMKRLLDGQFDECGLSIQELHKIEVSLVKSLSAVYHSRIKYPDTQPA